MDQGDIVGGNTYSVRVRSSDGALDREEVLLIAVKDINEAPTDIVLDWSSVYENSAVGTVVGSLTSTDQDNGDTHTYSLVTGTGSEDNGRFSIVGNELRLAFVPDHENPVDMGATAGNNTYSVRVRSSDGALGREEVFVVRVLDSNDTETDGDGDGIPDSVDRCPGTPTGTVVDLDGCPLFTLAADNFVLYVQAAGCRGGSDGRIELSAKQALDYTATLRHGDVEEVRGFTENIGFTGLGAGGYELCITVGGQEGYRQCYTVPVTEPGALSVASRTDVGGRTVSLSLKGSDSYRILLNGREYRTSGGSVELPLDRAENSLSVRGDRDCQGVYEETIVLPSEMVAYPNPLGEGELLRVELGTAAEGLAKVRAVLHGLGGDKLLDRELPVENGRVELGLDGLPSGTYLLSLGKRGRLYNQKIIKR